MIFVVLVRACVEIEPTAEPLLDVSNRQIKLSISGTGAGMSYRKMHGTSKDVTYVVIESGVF